MNLFYVGDTGMERGQGEVLKWSRGAEEKEDRLSLVTRHQGQEGKPGAE
jgi:hypothetical protein